MAATSGSLVPPTWVSWGCSQKRVQATGSTPQASNVSVTDGTRLTTRGVTLRCYPIPTAVAEGGRWGVPSRIGGNWKVAAVVPRVMVVIGGSSRVSLASSIVISQRQCGTRSAGIAGRTMDMGDVRLRVHGLGGGIEGGVLDRVAHAGDGPLAPGLDVHERPAGRELEEPVVLVDDLVPHVHVVLREPGIELQHLEDRLDAVALDAHDLAETVAVDG